MIDPSFEESNLLDKAISAAIDGDAVLFLGAGVGQYSKDVNGDTLPTGSQLCSEMSDKMGLDNVEQDLPRIAQYFRRKEGAFGLLNLLKSRLDVQSVESEFADFLELRWKRVYTTNYDNSIEWVRKNSKSFTIGEEPRGINKGDCVHFNGFVDQLTLENLDDSVILTDWNYAKSSLYDSTWAHFFRNDILSSSYTIFLGYSMRDLDIARIISLSNSKLKDRIIIIVSPKTSEIDIEVLSEYGVVFNTGAEHALKRVRYAKKKHSKIEKPYIYSSLTKSEIPDSLQNGLDASRIIYDQLVYGIIPHNQILSGDGSVGAVNVFFRRKIIDGAAEQAIKGEIDSILLIGNVATGKTYGTIQLEKDFLERNYKVYRAINSRNLKQDITVANSNESRSVFIFENYQDFIDEIEYLVKQNSSNHIIILTARTAVHELYEQKIEGILGTRHTVCDLERLSINEIADLDPMLNHAGLWSELAGWRSDRRIGYVQNSLGASLPRLLLKIVRSKEVKERVLSEIEPLLNDQEVSRFFACSLIINVLQFDFWINDWLVFFNASEIKKALKQYESVVSHFVNLSTSSVTLRSSLLANELIESIIDDRLTVEALRIVFEGASKNSSHDEEMGRLRVKLMMYSQVTRFFDDDPKYNTRKREALKSYYISIRDTKDTVNRSDYWLQYGIMLSIHGDIYNADDVEQAVIAFQNAFQREKARSRPNLVRVDNYYARFQLKKAIASSGRDESFELFMQGSQKLMSQVFDEETRHYPFKVGRLYSEIASMHYNGWNEEQKKRFLGRCKDLLKLGEKRLAERAQKDVEFLVMDLTKLIGNLELGEPVMPESH
ncbi:MAG: hypothetical protein CL535_17795 [Ahrensia sp.]|nr:hypothetical protein [Ahrensia sp.]|tara:strand:+ start:1477 stop:3972 length:2496 start_codon:yes stop_codon:yes gene_type:complete